MLLMADQIDIILRFIGYSKEEIDSMEEYEPIRKINAVKELISVVVTTLFGNNTGAPPGQTTIPFNNMPTDGSIQW